MVQDRSEDGERFAVRVVADSCPRVLIKLELELEKMRQLIKNLKMLKTIMGCLQIHFLRSRLCLSIFCKMLMSLNRIFN